MGTDPEVSRRKPCVAGEKKRLVITQVDRVVIVTDGEDAGPALIVDIEDGKCRHHIGATIRFIPIDRVNGCVALKRAKADEVARHHGQQGSETVPVMVEPNHLLAEFRTVERYPVSKGGSAERDIAVKVL
ncbi:MAG: hypothetical protein CMO26_23690 [Thiotrichales bacterium]|nr:hypothetical protein [Thiotrichales bacterium]